jgi:hypothetical protein
LDGNIISFYHFYCTIEKCFHLLHTMLPRLAAHRGRALWIVVPLLLALLLFYFAVGGNIEEKTVVTAARRHTGRSVAPGGVPHDAGHSEPLSADAKCDDDLFMVMVESLSAAASSELRNTHADLLASSANADRHNSKGFILRRGLRYTLYRKEELWSYSAMALMVDMLRVWHSSRNSSEKNVSLSSTTVVGRDCFAVVWRELSDQFAVILEHRLQHMGRINNGIIYVCPGFGGLVAMRKKGSSFRAGWFPQRLVADSAAKWTTNFTIFFLTFHDDDIYSKTRRKAHQRTALLHFLQEFPNFFLMHYSPSLVMPHGIGASLLGDNDPLYAKGVSVLSGAPRVVGALHPRMLPVPHSPTQMSETVALTHNATFMASVRDVALRTARVVWRGATTGHPVKVQHFRSGKGPLTAHRDAMRHFAATDRYRMVDAFNMWTTKQSRFDWADVAFSGFCQEVKAADVPRSSGKMHIQELAHYRVHLDVDGNTNSWEGLRWRLLLGMALVKVQSSQGYTQWFYRHLRNGTHLLHVPVEGVTHAAKALLDDVALAATMADAAYEFGQRHLTMEAMEAADEHSVRNAWHIGYDDQTKWCIAPC